MSVSLESSPVPGSIGTSSNGLSRTALQKEKMHEMKTANLGEDST